MLDVFVVILQSNFFALSLLKRFINLILFGNIWVAAGAACLVQSTVIQLGVTHKLREYSLLVFFSTLFIYNFQRIFYNKKSDVSLHSIRRKWIFQNQFTIRTLAGIGLAGIMISMFNNNWRVIIYLAPLLILSVAYFIPVIKLRKSAWFKLLTLVIVWTMVTAVVPIMLSNEIAERDLLLIALRFCFMMAICIPFDIRDLKIDQADEISTLPQRLGEKRTRMLAMAFMMICLALIITEYVLGMFGLKIFIALFLSGVLNSIMIGMSSSSRSEYFYVAGLDGTMILQGVMVIVAAGI